MGAPGRTLGGKVGGVEGTDDEGGRKPAGGGGPMGLGIMGTLPADVEGGIGGPGMKGGGALMGTF